MALANTVRDLLARKVGVPVTTRAAVVAALSGANGQLLKQDATRVFFLVVNIGGVVVFIAPVLPGVSPAASQGIRLEPNGGAATAWWEEDGEVTAYEWAAAGIGGAGSLFVMPVVIDRGGETL